MPPGDRPRRGEGAGRWRAALEVLVAGGPGAALRRARRFRERRRLREVPPADACRLWLDADRAASADPRRLDALRGALGASPAVSVVVLGPAPPTLGPDPCAAIETLAAAAPIGGLLASAAGEYIVFVRGGDGLRPGAIAEAAVHLRRHPCAVALVGDEEIRDGGGGPDLPRWKPGWSEDAHRGTFRGGCPVVVRREPARPAAAGIAGGDEAALYALLLRLHETPGAIIHLPKILGVTAGVPGTDVPARDRAFRAALASWAESAAPGAVVDPGLEPESWRLRRPLPRGDTLSVVIPTRDGRPWLERCVDSIRRSALRPDEIVVVDNGSTDPATVGYLRGLAERREARVLDRPGRFNFSALMNGAAREAKGDLVLFLNDDTELVEADSLETMAAEAARPEVAAVGPLLLYPDGTVQHAGLVTGMGVVAGHLYKGCGEAGVPWFVSPRTARAVSAVDGACLMARRELFLRLGGFDDRRLPVSFSDVDYCLRAEAEGFRSIYTPFARFIHHEGRTRRRAFDPREAIRMERRWGARLAVDPYFHPALSPLDETPRPRREGGAR